MVSAETLTHQIDAHLVQVQRRTERLTS
jgi:hypothetical protein